MRGSGFFSLFPFFWGGGGGVHTFVTAIWKVMSRRDWLALLEKVAFSSIGPSGMGRWTSVTIRRFESITSISLGFNPEPEGSADVNAQSSSSLLG